MINDFTVCLYIKSFKLTLLIQPHSFFTAFSYIYKKLAVKFFYYFLLIFVTACQKNDNLQESGLHTYSFDIDNVTRRYALYIPENLGNNPVPLVFELHGGGIYIEDMTGESGHKTPYKLWMPLADQEKFIVVYPEGLNGAYGKPTWNDCRGDCEVNSGADDVQFIDTLIQIISKKYPVDPKRIYASGTSNGGFMAQRLGMELGNKIAAVASVVASKPAVSKCAPPVKAFPILFMLGTEDNHMPYAGGYVGNPPNPAHGSVIPAQECIDFWVKFNQADSIPEYHLFPDLDPNDGGRVEKFSFMNPSTHKDVIFYKINGGGHSAPSIKERYSALFEQYFNKQNHDIEMTTEVWNFFKNKSLP